MYAEKKDGRVSGFALQKRANLGKISHFCFWLILLSNRYWCDTLMARPVEKSLSMLLEANNCDSLRELNLKAKTARIKFPHAVAEERRKEIRRCVEMADACGDRLTRDELSDALGMSTHAVRYDLRALGLSMYKLSYYANRSTKKIANVWRVPGARYMSMQEKTMHDMVDKRRKTITKMFENARSACVLPVVAALAKELGVTECVVRADLIYNKLSIRELQAELFGKKKKFASVTVGDGGGVAIEVLQCDEKALQKGPQEEDSHAGGVCVVNNDGFKRMPLILRMRRLPHGGFAFSN